HPWYSAETLLVQNLTKFAPNLVTSPSQSQSPGNYANSWEGLEVLGLLRLQQDDELSEKSRLH
ncbi:hypothetical protein, partial [Bacteroides uniformis]|uniref:hypothetical protein n=1 Tax=Bacteroides uniformis TaxID=820 RepID=UPI001AA1780F